MKTELISLNDILPETTYQLRDSSIGKNVAELCRLIADEVELDPIILWETPRGYIILDGFQRVDATRKVKGADATIRAAIKRMPGNCHRTALDIAIAANQRHGHTLERADRKKMALRLLAEDPLECDTVIAKKVGLGARTIANYRADVAGAQISTRRNEKGEIVNVRKPNGKKEKQVNQKQSGEVESDPQLTVTPDFLKKDTVAASGAPSAKSDDSESPHPEKPDVSSVPELKTLANICRLQAREFERRADFIEKLSHTSVLTPTDLELIHYVAEDASALEVADSPHWDERAEKLKAICVFLSELFAAGGAEDQAVS